MKGRESGMPDEDFWASFFNAEVAINMLWNSSVEQGNVIEFGCGYGTFTVPAAQRTLGLVTALDIEPEMVEFVRQKAETFELTNIRAEVRNFVSNGTGVENCSQAHALIFNLLHLEHPVALLREAYRTLQDGGVLSVIHWRSDISTPRGPSLEIRPSPEQCRAWMIEAGFHSIESVDLQSCCPFHFCLLATR
jgi:ubiquinone/menaquinone biosynthesis C-methylase UbiE